MCEKWCPLEETRFETLDEARGAEHICRLCVLTARLDRVEEENRQLTLRVECLEEQLKKERAEGTTGQEQREEIAGLGAHTESGPGDSGPSSGEETQTEEQSRSYVEALTQRQKEQVTALGESAEKEGGRMVIVAGDSNMRASEAEIRRWVRGDERVRVGVYPGQTVGEVMERAREQMWGNLQGQNLVVIAGGTNDVLKGRGAGVRKQLERGVRELRNLCPSVQIVVSTVPEIIGRGVHVEREVLAVNREIRTLGRAMNFEVVDINTEVRGVGWEWAFQRDGVHFSAWVGQAIGQRHAARAVAFLGGPRALVRRK